MTMQSVYAARLGLIAHAHAQCVKGVKGIGPDCMPAPISPILAVCSSTVTA
jgi:hypothetical protein